MLIEDLRTRVLKGEPLSLEETRTLLASIRRGYKSATEPAAKRGTTRSKSPTTKGAGLTLSQINEIF